jgi:hypothetical protein
MSVVDPKRHAKAVSDRSSWRRTWRIGVDAGPVARQDAEGHFPPHRFQRLTGVRLFIVPRLLRTSPRRLYSPAFGDPFVNVDQGRNRAPR